MIKLCSAEAENRLFQVYQQDFRTARRGEVCEDNSCLYSFLHYGVHNWIRSGDRTHCQRTLQILAVARNHMHNYLHYRVCDPFRRLFSQEDGQIYIYASATQCYGSDRNSPSFLGAVSTRRENENAEVAARCTSCAPRSIFQDA